MVVINVWFEGVVFGSKYRSAYGAPCSLDSKIFILVVPIFKYQFQELSQVLKVCLDNVVIVLGVRFFK